MGQERVRSACHRQSQELHARGDRHAQRRMQFCYFILYNVEVFKIDSLQQLTSHAF